MIPRPPPPPKRQRGAIWLELSVEADTEAVEAISEILSRVAPGGVSVEPAFAVNGPLIVLTPFAVNVPELFTALVAAIVD